MTGRFPGETSCLSLVWAVPDLFFTHASNGATFTELDREHLHRIKYTQADPDTLDEEVTAEPRTNLQRHWNATGGVEMLAAARKQERLEQLARR